MSARDAAPAESAQDLADRHDLRLIRAKQLCRPVLHKGLKQFIGGYCHHKGDAEMIVYLTGSAEQVRPAEITLLEQAE